MEVKYILGGVAFTLIAYLFWKYFIKIYDYWRDRGVPSAEGPLLFFGNSLPVITLRKSMGVFYKDVYDAYPDKSMVGVYINRTPHLVLRDPELVKSVLISNFANFHDNNFEIDSVLDPLVAENPFFNHGEKWKTERQRLSGALMSTKKLKILCGSVLKVCKDFGSYLDAKVRNGAFEVESRDLFQRYTGQVVAGAGFGIEEDFFSEKSDPNSFKTNVLSVFDPTWSVTIKHVLLFVLPFLGSLLDLRFLPKETDLFFRHVIKEMIALRRKDGIPRNDFLQVILDTQKVDGGDIDEFKITASATSFFLDGFETSGITLGFFAYQMGANQHIQDKLRREVLSVLEKHGGKLSFEAISEMSYMEQTLQESMRLIPVLMHQTKRCTNRCKLVGSDGIECIVEPGGVMIIPSYALQTDPEYWENPNVFDPERFSEDNKKDRPKTVYLPFGEGPRICVGMKFAIMQVKAAMATILRKNTIEISSRMKLPIKFKPSAMLTAVEGGVWLKIKPL